MVTGEVAGGTGGPVAQSPAPPERMSGWFRLTSGLLAVVVGAIWTVQGLGYVEDGLMTDQRIWAVLGPLLALVGVALLWWGMRARTRR